MSLWLMRKLAGSVLDDYFNFVAERISPWENIVMRGIRSGRTLKEHVFSGVFCIYGIKDLLGLGEEHIRLLMSAFTIHDLNKLAQDGISLGRLTDDHQWMKKLIGQVGIDRFFIRWEEFYFDLLTLIRFHSGHYNLLGHDFFAVKKKTLLEPGELEKLAHIMKMVDVLDLSVDFAGDDFKKTALFHLNAASARQYRWLYHRLAEHRGVFSNIIHNQVVAILKKRGAWPLLVYPEGVWYLWPVQAAPPVWPELVREVAASTGRVIEGFKVQDLSKVVNMTKDGIKVDESAVNTVRPGHLLAQVEKIIYRRKPKISDDLNRLKHRFERGGRSLEDYLKAKGLRLYTTEEEVFKGELIRTTYNLLKKHFKQKFPDPWPAICDKLELLSEIYEPFNLLYDRPFVMAANLPHSFAELKIKLKELWEECFDHGVGDSGKEAVIEGPLLSYLEKMLWVCPVEESGVRRFSAFLQAYCRSGHRQDCYGAFETETDRLMEAQVPKGIKVQQFSNRLPAGGAIEPKRYVSTVTKEQFFLERLVFRSGGKKAVYLHFMPVSFMPYVQLDILRKVLEDLAGDQDVLQGLNDRALREAGGILERNVFTALKTEGLSFPRFPETVAGVVTMPLYIDEDRLAERAVVAAEYAGRLAMAFNLKVYISESSVPALTAGNFACIYLDNATGRVAVFLDGGHLSRAEVSRLLDELIVLRRINAELTARAGENHLVDLAAALAGSPLRIFVVMDGALERKLRTRDAGKRDWVAVRASAVMAGMADELLERRWSMDKASSYLKELAKIAWAHGIRGSSLARNSLLYPLNEIFDHLRRETISLDLEGRRAALAEKIFAHLERISDYTGVKQFKAAEEFVNKFFAVLEDIYHGRVNRLLNEEKELKAAYLFYLRKEIMAASEARAAAAEGKDAAGKKNAPKVNG